MNTPERTLSYRAQEFLLRPLINRLTSDWLHRVNVISDATPLVYPSGFKERFVELVRAGGIPIGVLNHTSHFDFYMAVRVAQDWMKIAQEHDLPRPKGIYLPGTKSMFTGHQGPLLKEIQTAIKDDAEKSNVRLVMLVRKKDQEKYGMTPSNRELGEALVKSGSNGYGFLLLPEGTVKGGARTSLFTDQRYGLQKPADPSLDMIGEKLRKKGMEPVYVSVGIEGSYKVYTAGTIRLPTWRAVQAVRGKADPHLVSIKMGMPHPWSTIPNAGGEGTPIEDFMMRDLAQQLPEGLRGDYK